MANDLNGKVAIVTGASRGIGADIARVLARQGMTVIAAACTEQDGTYKIPGSLRETVDSITAETISASRDTAAITSHSGSSPM